MRRTGGWHPIIGRGTASHARGGPESDGPQAGTIGYHLKELGRRLLWIAAGLTIGSVIGWCVYPHAFAFIQQPLLDAGGADGRMTLLNFPRLGSALSTQIKLSIFLGFLISLPWTALQVGVYVWPGLAKREQRVIAVLLISATPLFLTGIAFGWLCMPSTIAVMADFAPASTATMVSAEDYLTFVMRMLVSFGVAFLLPIVMVGLTMMGVMAASAWLHGWRVAMIVAVVFAAVASPSGDIATLAVLTSPIVFLYFSAIGICAGWEWWQVKKLTRGDKHSPKKLTRGDKHSPKKLITDVH